MGCIYQIINMVNGKKYIGLTTKTAEERWIKHVKDALVANRSHAIHFAIRKYGKEKFTLSVLRRSDKIEELNALEKHFIEIKNTLSPNGYNLHSGGNFHLISEATRIKMSKAQTGKKQSLSAKRKKSKKLKNRPQEEWVIKQRALALRKPVREVISGIVFASVKEAAEKLGIKAKGISKNLHGKSNHYFGYMFEFIGKSICN